MAVQCGFETLSGQNMTKPELIELVRRIMEAEGSEKELDEAINMLIQNTNDPNVVDLIFHNDLTPTEVVEKALAYKPIILPFP